MGVELSWKELSCSAGRRTQPKVDFRMLALQHRIDQMSEYLAVDGSPLAKANIPGLSREASERQPVFLSDFMRSGATRAV